MNKFVIKKAFCSDNLGKLIIVASIILLYFCISIFFTKHFFFHTIINGVDVSLKSYEEAEKKIRGYVEDYGLRIIERNGDTEVLIGNNIEFRYNEKNDMKEIFQKQHSYQWIKSLFKDQPYIVKDLYTYNNQKLNYYIGVLSCLGKDEIETRNVKFIYTNGSYEVMKEIYGNKIKKDRLIELISTGLLEGIHELDIEAQLCYDSPKYTLTSEKTQKTKELLNKCIATKIIYLFGDNKETIDGTLINKWLRVNSNLDVEINEKAIINYIKNLSQKYDTVGVTRQFKTSLGKMAEVTGGLYGYKINQEAERNELLKNLQSGTVIEKEPIYLQRGLYWGKDDIGDTYVEISITRQYVWFYKEGKLICQGGVVTGNPNRGNATVLGTYMINYKQKDTTISGPGYNADVTYWMPFFGNMGLHDAKWRYSFGGKIYKRNGSHGCVNMPYSLAQKMYENIEEGTPVVIYEE